MRTYFLIFFCFLSLKSLISQERIANVKLENYSTDFFKKKESYVIKDENKNQLIFFIEDVKGTHVLFFSKDLELKKALFTKEIYGKRKILGHKIKNGKYLVFLNSKKFDKILTYELIDSESSDNLIFKSEFIIPEEEFFLGYVLTDDNFFRFSILPNSSDVLVYEEEEYKLKQTKSLDFSFLNVKLEYETKKADYVLTYGAQRGLFTQIDNLESNVNVDLTNSISKVYKENNNKLILTLDLMTNHTKFIELDLNTFQIKVDYFKKPSLTGDIKAQNTFLYDKKLFSTSLNTKEIVVEITDIESKKILFSKKYVRGQKEDFFLKESPIVEYKNGVFRKINSIMTFDQLLKKFKSQNFGIVVKKYDSDDYLFSLASNYYYYNYQITTIYATEISAVLNNNFELNQNSVPNETFYRIIDKSFFQKFVEETTIKRNYDSVKNEPKMILNFKFNSKKYISFLGAQDKNWYIFNID